MRDSENNYLKIINYNQGSIIMDSCYYLITISKIINSSMASTKSVHQPAKTLIFLLT